MRGMMRNRDKMTRTAAAVLVAAMAGACASGHAVPAASGHPSVPSATLTDAQLNARLLVDADIAGAAWHMTAFPAPSGSADASVTAGTEVGNSSAFDCSEMIDGLTFLKSAGSPAASASEVVGGRGGAATPAGTIDRSGIQGTELLYSYAGDGAREALAKVRELVARCSGPQTSADMTTTFSLAAAPALGDDGVLVRAVEDFAGVARFVSDTLIVRSGSTVVVVTTLQTTEHNAAIATASLGAVAVKKASGPVPAGG